MILGTVQIIGNQLRAIMKVDGRKLDRVLSLQRRADEEGRTLYAHEAFELDGLLAELERGSGRQTRPAAISSGLSTRAGGSWKNIGDFAKAVKNASREETPISNWDPRLRNAPTSVGTEGVGADGGFAVPADFRTAVMRKVLEDNQLLPRCFQVTTPSNNLTWPKDETPPWSTSAGIRAYWEGEAALHTQTKPLLEGGSIRLNKLTCLVPISDELLEDAPGMSSYLASRIPAAITQRVTDAIIDGTGVGQPLGFLRSGCRVVVSKETSQAAGTVKAQNIAKMWSRMLPSWRTDAVWVAHSNVEPQLMSLAYQATDVANLNPTGSIPLYIPPGGFNDSPYAMILGKPVIICQTANDLGTEGDLTFFSPSQYLAAMKAAGTVLDTSIHLWFDYSVTAFRATFRMGGQPMWSSPVTGAHSSTTYSPIVTLQAR